MIDAHAHLTDDRFAEEVGPVLDRARASGVDTIVTIATDLADSVAAQRLAAVNETVFATVGIHPHAAAQAPADAGAQLRALAALPRVVALGETGLDYHYDLAPRELQRELFALHLELGAELDLPVVVHSRDADHDLASLVRAAGPGTRGVLHCFAGGPELLDAALEVGWYVSFAGMVTFKRYDSAELLRAVPLERLMVETDSPYLTPVPHRGKRNEPAYVPLVVARVAELRGEQEALVASATARNARTFFRLPPPTKA